MDPSLYPRMAEVEDQHWWFAARRAICDELLANCGLPRDAAILEPGCGTGGNFPWLARYGRVYAIDSDPAAVEFASARRAAEVTRGALPDAIPFGARRFDLAVMTDVLEHLDEPVAALRAVRARLKPSGVLLLTVPALPRLWSEHDVTHHHRRRYRIDELRESICIAGFTLVYISYYNFILLPAIAIARALSRLTHRPMPGEHDLVMPPAIVNRILFRVFSSERHLIGKCRAPIGVSLIVLARA
jgi:SAM-dependent methyltransferase